ncbi:S1 family peptidase [Jidongwangia harbinensis]|uniref:S1 family peptidase n=1 Tax=Jidongwangia harbinensis TaxID=2878561 RepID=UPI001CD9968F|nr:S1 family peptidase [Jidongwangia harbinensis]MCA2214134.1 S1 family peptidase [Jidongwangia harbinensis]
MSAGTVAFAGVEERTSRAAAPDAASTATSEARQIMAAQAPLSDVADRIEDAVARDGESGIAGLEVDAEASTVRLRWRGELSPAVSEVVADATADGVRVDVLPGRYRRSDLWREALRLTGQPGVTSARPMLDGAGLYVSSTKGQVSSDVHTVAVASPRLKSATRQADTAPFRGGAQIRRGDSICTSSFGVTGNDGRRYLMTAEHCGAGNWTTDAGVPIGTSQPTVSVRNDVQLIAANSGSTIYNGDGVRGGNQYTTPVTGAGRSHGGERMCVSGAQTGTVCNLKYIGGGSYTIDGKTRVLQAAEQQDRWGAVTGGDSGAPVFTLTGPRGDTAEARGLFSMMFTEPENMGPCNGQPSAGMCSSLFLYGDINPALTELGVRMNVG